MLYLLLLGFLLLLLYHVAAAADVMADAAKTWGWSEIHQMLSCLWLHVQQVWRFLAFVGEDSVQCN